MVFIVVLEFEGEFHSELCWVCGGFKLEVEGKVKQKNHVQLARDREDADFLFIFGGSERDRKSVV